jgi:hypothetical protein
MLTLELKELSQSKCGTEISKQELDNIAGGGIGSSLYKIAKDGVIYEALKAGGTAISDYFTTPPSGIDGPGPNQVGISPASIGVDVTGATSNIA